MNTTFETFLLEREAEGRSPATIRKYRLHIGYFLDWCAQSNPPKPFTRATFSEYLVHLRGSKKPNTVANYFAEVVNYCNWLVETGHLDHNMAARLKPKRVIRKMPSYARHHILRLLDGASVRDYAVMITFLDTGLRASEMAQLRISTIDWTTGHFLIIGKADRQRSGWIGRDALPAVHAYRATRAHFTEDALWLNWRGHPLTGSGLYTIIKRRVQAAGLRGDVRRLLHSFRVTFAKNYIKRGGDTITLAGLMGHTRMETTRRYADLYDDDLREKKESINPLATYIDEDMS